MLISRNVIPWNKQTKPPKGASTRFLFPEIQTSRTLSESPSFASVESIASFQQHHSGFRSLSRSTDVRPLRFRSCFVGVLCTTDYALYPIALFFLSLSLSLSVYLLPIYIYISLSLSLSLSLLSLSLSLSAAGDLEEKGPT